MLRLQCVETDKREFNTSNVYFCCNPKDFDKYFKDISDEILRNCQCSIWYDAAQDLEKDEAYFQQLQQMQLFVIPVTSSFLTDEAAQMESSVRFAVEHHIPVLPLMQEKDLEALFREKFGDLYYLSKFEADDAVISYEEKLETCVALIDLDEVFLEQLQNVYDAYVYLKLIDLIKETEKPLKSLVRGTCIRLFCNEGLRRGETFVEAMKEGWPFVEHHVWASASKWVPERDEHVIDEPFFEGLLKILDVMAHRPDDKTPVHNTLLDLAARCHIA